jgi:DNA repair ATPase RecN
VIGSTAAVSQLLGQAITVIQKIQDARAKVHGASKRIDGYKGQLDNILQSLRLVQDEPELRTPAIQEQIQVIVELGKELQDQLDAFAARLSKSKAKQYTHAFTSGDRDEKCLDDLCTRLDRAKADLTARIVTAHVGLSGTMRNGFTAALAIIQRVDRNVQRVLGERLSIAAQLHGRSMDADGAVWPHDPDYCC